MVLMSARTKEERQLVAHIRGKSPRNVERRTSIIRAYRESQERHRRAWLEIEGVRESLNKKRTILDEYFSAKANKELASIPDSTGEELSEDCEYCRRFRDGDFSACLNCGKPLFKPAG